MRRLLPDRCLAVTSPITVYRPIGRRPSRVYLDETMNPTNCATSPHRLSDRVFWRTHADPGDQIHECAGGTYLLTGSGAFHPIQLAEPRALEVSSAFTHAELMLQQDRAVARKLVAEGSLIEEPARKAKTPPSRMPKHVFAQDEPLIVDRLPRDLRDPDRTSPPDDNPRLRGEGEF